MSHDLDHTTGKAAMAYIGETPWHGLGEQLPPGQPDHIAMMSLYGSAPGQDTETAKGTLWGAVNAVTFYADHVRPGGVVERLDSAWFGAGNTLKERAWAEAEDLMDPKKTAA